MRLMAELDHIVFAVLPIYTTSAYSNERQLSGTGFFYFSKERLYLVSAKHVFLDNISDHRPDSFEIILHKASTHLTEVGHRRLNLYDENGRQLWLEHPTDRDVDIAAIPIDEKNLREENYFFIALSCNDFYPSESTLSVGEDVFVAGYPRAVYDEEHNLPVFRKAMIASVYGVPYRERKYFLIDSLLHPGTSGAPVLTKKKARQLPHLTDNISNESSRSYLVGIHSGDLHEKLELGIAWYSELLEEIIK